LNNNRSLDAGEPSATTAADGSYSFTLPSGSYTIREVLPAGWRQTSPGEGRLFAARVSQNGGVPTTSQLSASGAVLNSFPAPAPALGRERRPAGPGGRGRQPVLHRRGPVGAAPPVRAGPDHRRGPRRGRAADHRRDRRPGLPRRAGLPPGLHEQPDLGLQPG